VLAAVCCVRVASQARDLLCVGDPGCHRSKRRIAELAEVAQERKRQRKGEAHDDKKDADSDS